MAEKSSSKTDSSKWSNTIDVAQSVSQARTLTRLLGIVSEICTQVRDATQQASLKRDFFTLKSLELHLRRFGADFSKLTQENVKDFTELLKKSEQELENAEVKKKLRDVVVNNQANVLRLMKPSST